MLTRPSVCRAAAGWHVEKVLALTLQLSVRCRPLRCCVVRSRVSSVSSSFPVLVASRQRPLRRDFDFQHQRLLLVWSAETSNRYSDLIIKTSIYKSIIDYCFFQRLLDFLLQKDAIGDCLIYRSTIDKCAVKFQWRDWEVNEFSLLVIFWVINQKEIGRETDVADQSFASC